MAVQVAQAADPKTAVPSFSDSVLSPVSKLEVARKHAAVEQQKRIEEACARMVEIKKENAGKRKVLEEKLDSHKKTKVQKTTTTVVTETTTTAVAVSNGEESIVKKLVDNFADEENTTATQETTYNIRKQQTTASASYDATRELLRATRSKLNDLVKDDEAAETPATDADKTEATAEGDWNGPSTNYHLKHLGLAKKKIDIYAPVEVQQQEIRRLRDRSRYEPKKIVEAIEDNDSENDSDFLPEVESENEEDSDMESIPEVEAEETLQLVQEAEEHAQQLRQKALLVRIPVYILFFCVVAVAVLAAVELTQQHYQFCTLDAHAVDGSEERMVSCASFLQARDVIKAFVEDTTGSIRVTAVSLQSRFQEL